MVADDPRAEVRRLLDIAFYHVDRNEYDAAAEALGKAQQIIGEHGLLYDELASRVAALGEYVAMMRAAFRRGGS